MTFVLAGSFVYKAFGEEYEPENFVSHYEFKLNEENTKVNVWFVPTGDDIPSFLCENRKTFLYGCTRHFIHPWAEDYVYIALDAPKYDKYGYTFLAHELKHVLCNCNWHD
jgi:hypothetical protein